MAKAGDVTSASASDPSADAASLADGDAGGVGPIDGNLTFQLRLAHGTALRHFTDTFADLELTQQQLSVLWLVNDHPGIAQTDLARRLNMDRATMMAIVNRLQARTFVRRDRSATDGRKQALHLEAEGEAMLARARIAIARHEAWARRRFSPREVQVLTDLLARFQA